MLDKFFAPFWAKIAEAEDQCEGTRFLQLYFFLLIPYGIWLNIVYVLNYTNEYVALLQQPWYHMFGTLVYASTPLLVFMNILCLIWQFIELRQFSARFLITLLVFFALIIVWDIEGYIFISINVGEIFATLFLYFIVLYYFYKRRHLFKSKTTKDCK